MALIVRPLAYSGAPVDGGPPALVQLALPLLASLLARLAAQLRVVAEGLGFQERRQVLVEPGPELVAELLVLGCQGEIHGGRVADRPCTLTPVSGNGATTRSARVAFRAQAAEDVQGRPWTSRTTTSSWRSRTWRAPRSSASASPQLLRELADDPTGITPALWSTLVDLGWTGLLVPAELGGTGAGLLETCIVLEQMGRLPLPGPFFSSAVAATLAARSLGATELLADLAAGTRRGTIALGEQGHGEPLATVRTRARRKARAVGR